jgi:hypothetical protein
MADPPKVLADTGPWKIIEILPSQDATRSIVQILASRDIIAKGDLQFTMRNLESLISALVLAKEEKEKLFKSSGALEDVDIEGEEGEIPPLPGAPGGPGGMPGGVPPFG